MTGALNISDFSHGIAKYPSVDGTNYTLSMRNAYLNATPVPGKLTKATGTDLNDPRLFPAHRAAHTYIYSTETTGSNIGRVHRRRIPCDPTLPVAPIADISGASIDGLT